MPPRRRLILTHLLAAAVAVAGTVAVGRWSGGRRSAAPSAAPFAESDAGLDRLIEDVRLEAMTLGEAFAELGRLGGTHIEVDWDQLAAAGFDRDQRVYLHLRDVSFGDALANLLTQVNASRVMGHLGYTTRNNVVFVGDATKLPVVARAYDVRDLIDPTQTEWRAAAFDIRLKAQGVFGGGGGGGSRSYHATESELGYELSDLVRDCVDPGLWTKSGGSVGHCDYFDGRLVVVQTMDSHRRVRHLLQVMRHPLNLEPPREASAAAGARGRASTPWAVPYETPGDAALRRQLNNVVLDAVPFAQAIGKLADLAGTAILIDGDALDAAEFDRDTPVSVRGSGTLGDLLGQALASCSASGPAVEFGLLDGCIVVTAGPLPAAFAFNRMYDVSDIVPPDPLIVVLPDMPETRQEAVEDLVRLIQDTVDPESWRENGGSGSIRQLFDRRLLIGQTWRNHEKVERLLREVARREFASPAPATTRPAPR